VESEDEQRRKPTKKLTKKIATTPVSTRKPKGKSYLSTALICSLRRDAKIEKFDTKTKFCKQTGGSIRCRNVISVD
jgi:hypothetical protein